jgi:hypothetical protein
MLHEKGFVVQIFILLYAQILSMGESIWEMATWELTSARNFHCASAIRCDKQLLLL